MGRRHSFLRLIAHYVCKRCLALWQTPPPKNLRYKWVVQQSFNIIDSVSVHQTSRGVYSVTLHCTGFAGLNDPIFKESLLPSRVPQQKSYWFTSLNPDFIRYDFQNNVFAHDPFCFATMNSQLGNIGRCAIEQAIYLI